MELTEGQVRRRYETVSGEHKERDGLIVLLYGLERLTRKDILALTVIDVDLERRELRLQRRRRFQGIKKETEQALKRYLQKRREYRPKTDYMVVGKDGKALKGLTRILRENKVIKVMG